MKIILISCFLFLSWNLEINGDTFEVLTIPYEQLFPNGHSQNGQTYQKPGYQQHYRPGSYHHRPGYQQPYRPGYQQNNQKPGIAVSNSYWECRNPSTGDMLLISTDNLPPRNTQNPGQQPSIPNVQPTQPPTTSSQNPNNPFLPNTNTAPAPINCNTYPQHPMCGETIILGTTTHRSPEKETTPNTNGEGLLDIRFG